MYWTLAALILGFGAGYYWKQHQFYGRSYRDAAFVEYLIAHPDHRYLEEAVREQIRLHPHEIRRIHVLFDRASLTTSKGTDG